MNSRAKRRVTKEIARLHKLNADFSSIDLQYSLNLQAQMTNLTFRRHLQKLGYHYLASRKKGLISETDKKKRVAFAKDIKTRGETEKEELEFWKSGISMYVGLSIR